MVERLTISRAVVERAQKQLESALSCCNSGTPMFISQLRGALTALNESMAAENVKMRGAAQWADKCGQIFIYIDNEKITVGDFVLRIQQDAIASCNPEPRNGWQPNPCRLYDRFRTDIARSVLIENYVYIQNRINGDVWRIWLEPLPDSLPSIEKIATGDPLPEEKS